MKENYSVCFDSQECAFIIWLSTDIGRAHGIRINLSDFHISDALKKLGWTPPGEKKMMRLAKEDAAAASKLMFDYDALDSAMCEYGIECQLYSINSGSSNVACRISPAELRASIDRQKKEAQDALAKLGIEYP